MSLQAEVVYSTPLTNSVSKVHSNLTWLQTGLVALAALISHSEDLVFIPPHWKLHGIAMRQQFPMGRLVVASWHAWAHPQGAETETGALDTETAAQGFDCATAGADWEPAGIGTDWIGACCACPGVHGPQELKPWAEAPAIRIVPKERILFM